MKRKTLAKPIVVHYAAAERPTHAVAVGSVEDGLTCGRIATMHNEEAN